jgi:hypothetical protein
MLVTEDEARVIRCPLAYSASFQHPNGAQVTIGGSGGAIMSAPTFCIGSKCMAWRWWDVENKTTGFCGMAGDPIG